MQKIELQTYRGVNNRKVDKSSLINKLLPLNPKLDQKELLELIVPLLRKFVDLNVPIKIDGDNASITQENLKIGNYKVWGGAHASFIHIGLNRGDKQMLGTMVHEITHIVCSKLFKNYS